ncbi:hypothetical protein H6503_03855 [Candidatus Woesearchaeota archaeon]|nr:hypothetical protein [Candidatus Woesearchaeota archaeon]
MEQDQVKQMVAVYMMMDEELREGNFLRQRYHRLRTTNGRDVPTDQGVALGRNIDIVASCMEQDLFFGYNGKWIDAFMYKGEFWKGNGVPEMLEAGKVEDMRGVVVENNGRYSFKQMTIGKKEYLEEFGAKDGFLAYATALRLAGTGIQISDGNIYEYGEHQLRSAANKGMLVITPLELIANRLYDKAKPKIEDKPEGGDGK